MRKECLTIIGTAHVSEESVKEVQEAIHTEEPDIVAIELDHGRYTRLLQEKEGTAEDEQISATKIIKENKVGVFLAGSALSFIQARIGKDLDIKPGSEMIAAIEAGEEVGAKIALIDRDINITLQRALNKMTIGEKLKFIYGGLASFFVKEDELEDIEELKDAAKLDEIMEQFKDISPGAYQVLVKERDAYLAQSLINLPDEKIIAVVGAGHKKGMNNYIDNPETIPPFNELVDTEKKGFPWLKAILFMIPVLFVVIFFLAFFLGIDIKWNLLDFLLIGGGMAFLGSILSGSKIQSALVAFIVAPLTIIHPLLAAGWFSGLVEAKYRKVYRSDITNLTHVESLKDLWKNNIFRVLLVVVGTNLGVSIATLVILPSKVFIPLFLKIFGL
ncbi:MAG: TraB/GumN family protein [Methanobacteriaceae archaeon]